MARAKLSMAFTDLRGRMGDEVLVLTKSGLAVRGRPTYKYPKNANVEMGTQRFKAAIAVWNELDLAQFQAWQRYAEGIDKRDPITGKQYSPTAKTAFIGLSTKVLQIDPQASIPVLPPTEELIADAMVLGVGATATGVTFTATGSNAADTSTEILFQKLLNVRRSPSTFYKSLLFHRFTLAEPTLEVPLEPGVYAFAYRFVRPTTGQTTLMHKLGVIEVEPA